MQKNIGKHAPGGQFGGTWSLHHKGGGGSSCLTVCGWVRVRADHCRNYVFDIMVVRATVTQIDKPAFYPVNLDTGNPTFKDRDSVQRMIERVEVAPSMVAAQCFVLQSVAALIFRNHNRWKTIAELSRLLHPAEFDFSFEIVIPAETTTLGIEAF